jgi:hypothetical protein
MVSEGRSKRVSHVFSKRVAEGSGASIHQRHDSPHRDDIACGLMGNIEDGALHHWRASAASTCRDGA